MKQFFSYFLAPFMACACFGSGAGAAAIKPVVVELFTSQGCSSCPPADKLVAKLADDVPYLVLSYHVDYWDGLGWKDPFSSPASTARQRDYQRWLKGDTIFTPQIVLNGRQSVVGSREAEVKQGLSQIATLKNEAIEQIHRDAQGLISVNLRAQTLAEPYEIIVIGFQKEAVTPIGRGENSGKTITQRHNVLSQHLLGIWSGEAKQWRFQAPKGDGVAVLIQSPKTGELIAAGMI